MELAGGKVFVKGTPGRALSLGDVARTVHFQSHTLPKDMEPSLEATNTTPTPLPGPSPTAHT
jgi:hypothetical protein